MPTIWIYLGFVVALLILIWAILEMRSRLTRTRRKNTKVETIRSWIGLDSTAKDALQEEPLLPAEEDNEEQEEKSGQDLHTRAQQNGHYSESKKLL
ncbi:MAG: hypothetical protein ACJ8CB_11800 [Ktedonobacteraceae bacterium]|jgi:hypothetical protein